MIYNSYVIDVTNFTEFHPGYIFLFKHAYFVIGGGEILEDYNCYDISAIMTDIRIHNHS